MIQGNYFQREEESTRCIFTPYQVTVHGKEGGRVLTVISLMCNSLLH